MRIDGIIDSNNKFLLMELEMIEPYMEMQQAQLENPKVNIIENYINCFIH